MVNQEMFEVREQDGLRLIIPSHSGGVSNAPWSKDTLIYRSRVETLDGETVSQGFKKFFNLGTGPIDLQVSAADVARACEANDAIATLKLDGSLLIRSVWNGKVILRTRGSFGYEHIDNAHEMEDFFTRYPKLFDPSFEPEVSLLFEWTSPNNVIVLKYPEPELTLIGAIDHDDYTYYEIDALSSIAETIGCPIIKHFKLDSNGWAELQSRLEQDNEIEGYVIRLYGESVLVKVKCLPYLTKHALKSTLTTDKLADMYFQQGRPSFKAFCDNFMANFDEETFMWAMPAISAMYDGVKHLNAIEAHMKEKIAGREFWPRKDAAIAGQSEYGNTKRFSMYMSMWLGKEVKTDILKSVLLQNCKQVELSMFGAALRAGSEQDGDDDLVGNNSDSGSGAGRD